jgi:hypothetical protein
MMAFCRGSQTNNRSPDSGVPLSQHRASGLWKSYEMKDEGTACFEVEDVEIEEEEEEEEG